MIDLDTPDAYCTLAQVDALHDRALREHGGNPGLLRAGCPESSLSAAWMATEYSELRDSYPHLIYASHLLYYFAKNHCFVDGNKRTAWLSTLHVLARIGLEVEATDDEATDFVESVAANKITDIDVIVKWLGDRLCELKPVPAAQGAATQAQAALPSAATPASGRYVDVEMDAEALGARKLDLSPPEE